MSSHGTNESTTAVYKCVRANLDLLTSPFRYHQCLNEGVDSDGTNKSFDISNVWKVVDVPCRLKVKRCSKKIGDGTVKPQLKQLHLVHCISNATTEMKKEDFLLAFFR